MRDRMGNASQRTLGIALGLFFGVAMAIFSAVRGPSLPVAVHLVVGVVAGVPFGAIMGRTLVRQREELRARMGDLDDAGRTAALRAADRGGVPHGEGQAAAAARVLEYRLEVMARQRRWSLPLFVLLTVGTVVLAITSSRWFWAGTIVPLLLIFVLVLQPPHLQRRLESLRRDASAR